MSMANNIIPASIALGAAFVVITQVTKPQAWYVDLAGMALSGSLFSASAVTGKK